MELFKNTNYDFLGKKWPFIIASLVLTVAGFASILARGGLDYGIDFKGGALMTVKFAYPPPVEKIRTAMAPLGEVSVQNFTGGTAQNEVAIGSELTEERQLDLNRQKMAQILATTFGQPGNTKPDFNNVGADTLAQRLVDPLARNGVPMSLPQLLKLSQDIRSYVDSNYSGLITDFKQLTPVPGMNPGIMNTLQQEFYLSPYHVIKTEMVGPKVGAELRTKAVLATLYALAGMLVYIAFRFEWIYGLGAVIACFHDTLITIGLFSIFHEQISMTVIAALLTLVGYSMNDTIVIFDRIRENLKISRRESLEQVMNRAVNQTLSRTIMTSGLTFLTVVALFLFGGPVLHGFSFALVCGIIVGTYSSVFIASPIVLFWHNYVDKRGGKRTPPAAPAESSTRGGGRASQGAAGSRSESARKSPSKAAK